MPSIEEILKAQTKPKERELLLVTYLREQPAALEQLLDYYPMATKSEKGTCMSALAAISIDNPRFVIPHLDFVFAQISADAPRIKWEASEIVARVAAEFPDGAAEAVPALIENTSDEGTVVRWSTAYALTEIAKSHPASRDKLIPLFRELVTGETKNGVRKLYEKALKTLGG
jgi:HEAT repeat protein